MTGRKGTVEQRSAQKRLRRTVARLEDEILADIEVVYKKPIEEWDWEELSRGYPKDEDGAFPKRKPAWITPAITAEVQRRMRNLSEHELMTYAQQAIKTLAGLMTNEEYDDFGKPVVPASVKMQSATYILNHVIGTPKARVEVVEHNPLMEMMGAVLVNPDGNPSHIVVEGTIEEPDDDDGGGE